MPTDPDFQELLQDARRGDDAAWRRLYEAHSNALLGYLRAQRAPAPEDLLAETWLQVVRDLHRFHGEDSGFRPWLLTIAHNRLLDARRSASRRPVEVDAEPERDGGAVEPATAQLEAEQELARLLEGIPERQRSVLYLRFVLDMPQREVAQVMGVSTPALKMLQTRAVRSLERRMAELADASSDDALRFRRPRR